VKYFGMPPIPKLKITSIGLDERADVARQEWWPQPTFINNQQDLGRNDMVESQTLAQGSSTTNPGPVLQIPKMRLAYAETETLVLEEGMDQEGKLKYYQVS
jgi:hypothetical protein